MKRFRKFLPRIRKKIAKPKNWFFKLSTKKKIIVVVIILVVLIVVKQVFFKNEKSKYSFDTASYGEISQIVTETGNVIASDETDVYSPTNGVLDTIFVRNGQQVVAGDKLFTVRSTATAQEQAAAYATYQTDVTSLNVAEQGKLVLQAQLEQARQAVIGAQSAVDIMNSNVGGSKNNPSTGSPYTQNDKDAINSNLTSAHESFTAIEKKYNDANAAISSATATQTSAFLAYQATQNATIIAPTNGTVSNIVGLVGAKVIAQTSSASTAVATTTLTTPTTVLVISNKSGKAIKTTASEIDINKLNLGQQVDILFSAIPNVTYKGTIVQLDSFGTDNSGVITYNVFVQIENPNSDIKPNMTANLTIKTADKKNVLTVSNAAIVPYQNGKAVQILDKKNKVEFLPVKVGLRGFSRSEIIDGVKSGTKVILGNTKLTNDTSQGPSAN